MRFKASRSHQTFIHPSVIYRVHNFWTFTSTLTVQPHVLTSAYRGRYSTLWLLEESLVIRHSVDTCFLQEHG